jgi:hypothetical protein
MDADPDPGGLKTNGSYGSGSSTLPTLQHALFFTNLFVAAILGQLEDVGMIPDAGEILGVVEEAALPSPLQPPVQPHLARLGVVLQVELVQLPLHVRHVDGEDILQLGLQVGHQHVVVQPLHAPLQTTKTDAVQFKENM